MRSSRRTRVSGVSERATEQLTYPFTSGNLTFKTLSFRAIVFLDFRMEWNGIWYSGQIRSFSADRRRREKGNDRARRKHPTKLVKAAACCLLSPLTTTGWILRLCLDFRAFEP